MMGMRRTMMDAQVTVSLSVLLCLFVEMKNAMGQNPAVRARRTAGRARRRNAGMRWMMIAMVRSTVQMRIARHSRTTGAGEMILCAAMEHVMERNRARAVRRTAAHVPLNPSAGMISVMEQKPVIRVKEIAGNATTKRDAGME